MQVFKVPSAFQRTEDKTHPNCVEYRGENFIVGNVTSSSLYPITISHLIEYYPVVLRFVSKKFSVSSASISLPASVFFEMRKSGQLNSEIDKIKTYSGYENLIALPQGIMALEKIVSDGKMRNGKTLVIDGGFNTINIAICDENYEIRYSKTYFNQFGIRDLIDKYFVPKINSATSGELTSSLVALKEIFLKGFVIKGFEKLDFSQEKKAAIQTFINDMLKVISADLSREMLEIEQVTIIGGLSYYVSSDNIKIDLPLYIPEKDGEFLNVLGMNLTTSLPSIDFGFGDIKIAI